MVRITRFENRLFGINRRLYFLRVGFVRSIGLAAIRWGGRLRVRIVRWPLLARSLPIINRQHHKENRHTDLKPSIVRKTSWSISLIVEVAAAAHHHACRISERQRVI